jgi:hypothetical protein
MSRIVFSDSGDSDRLRRGPEHAVAAGFTTFPAEGPPELGARTVGFGETVDLVGYRRHLVPLRRRLEQSARALGDGGGLAGALPP